MLRWYRMREAGRSLPARRWGGVGVALTPHMPPPGRARTEPRWAGPVRRLPWWAVLLLIFAACAAIYQLSSVLFAPWAVSWLPGPKLIGSYTGVLEAEQGARYRLIMDVTPKIQRASPGARFADNLAG